METQAHILIVEDEPNLAFNLKLNLERELYKVSHAPDGKTALEIFRNDPSLELILLDVMIPEPDGIQVARTIRAKNKAIGIIMLTARATENDRLRGLELGVDDYISKPFHLQELLLKVKRSVERVRLFAQSVGNAPANKQIKAGLFSLDTESLELNGPHGQFSLTALEADVLYEFMINSNRVLTREHLLEKVWHMQGNLETRTVDNFVMRLRRYLENDPTNPQVLESVRGRGYRFKVATDSSSPST